MLEAGSSLREVRLRDEPPVPAPIAADRTQALADLCHDAVFLPIPRAGQSAHPGPFNLTLGLAEGRLVLEAHTAEGVAVMAHGMALGALRRSIRDYATLVDSHAEAIATGTAARVQAIDMGRRGLHDEAAGILRERLAGHVALDHATSRRLFTLLCVLCRRD